MKAVRIAHHSRVDYVVVVGNCEIGLDSPGYFEDENAHYSVQPNPVRQCYEFNGSNSRSNFLNAKATDVFRRDKLEGSKFFA